MKGLPTDFWGKLAADPQEPRWHPLIDHCTDVAAVTEALLQRTLLRRRLARLGGLDELTPVQVARLCALALLHDFGKASVHFQNKAWPGRGPRAGHVEEALVAICNPPIDAALDLDTLLAWTADGRAGGLVVSTLCHHGTPYRLKRKPLGAGWRPAHGLDPVAEVRRLTAAARAAFAAAWEGDGPPFPASPALQHGWNGLLTLADWIGSNEHFFPFRDEQDAADRLPLARQRAAEIVAHLGLDVDAWRGGLARPPGFTALTGRPAPRHAQAVIATLPASPRGSVTVLEAETGAGKTEAALWHFAHLFQRGEVDGLYFALPTRTAATQIFRRVREMVERIFPQPPPVVLAVPGQLEPGTGQRARLPPPDRLWPDRDAERFEDRLWAAERPKRFLAATVAVGTIDQALLASLLVRHAHLRATALLRHLLVVDEVHASDTYMGRLLEAVLDHHRAAGGHALLMSATLGSALRTRLLQPGTPVPALQAAEGEAYPALSHQELGAAPILRPVAGEGEKRVRVKLLSMASDPAAVAQRALQAAVRGARVLVVRNLVRDAVDTQEALEGLAAPAGHEALLFRCRGVPAPHHSRYAREDRQRLDEAIEAAFHPAAADHGGVVAVATQTVQQSLDLDADLMISDLCPMDVLLQRLGRLHRHQRARPPGFEAACVEVLLPASRDELARLAATKEGRGDHGWGTVYPDLRILEATWQELEAHPQLAIPALCRGLVERTTHPHALSAVAKSLGAAGQRQEIKAHGTRYSERGLASNHLMPWDEPFGAFALPDLDGKVRTRLGLDDVAVELATPEAGPFGGAVRRLTVRPYFLGAGLATLAPDTQPQIVERAPGGGFVFTLVGARLRYDRLGLRPDQPATRPQEALEDE